MIPEAAPAGWTAPYGADPSQIHTAVQDRIWPSAAAAKAGGVPVTHNAAGRPMAGFTEEQVPAGVKKQIFEQGVERLPGGEWTRNLAVGALVPGQMPGALLAKPVARLGAMTQTPSAHLLGESTYPTATGFMADMATRGASQHAPGEGANAQPNQSAWGKINAVRQRNAYEGEQAHPILGLPQTIQRGIKSTKFVQEHPWAQRLVDPTNVLGPSKVEKDYTQDMSHQYALPAGRMTYNSIAQPNKPMPSRFLGALNQGSAATPAQESAWRAPGRRPPRGRCVRRTRTLCPIAGSRTHRTESP